jgi:cytochrome c oxidase cbb3-type subunit I/II
MARAQAKEMAAGIAAEGGPAGLEDKEITALVAYLQRLGKDIKQATGVAHHAAPADGGM